jgi:hypothetical protein
MVLKATSDEAAEINNLNNPTDLRKMDFGQARDPQDVFEPDRVNFGPRAGFAWTVDHAGATVVRGGVGVFTSGHLMAQFQNAVARPFSPGRHGWNAAEIAARGVRWPQYAEELNEIVIRDAAGRKNLSYLIQSDIKSPETLQATVDVQRQIGRLMMVSGGYVHTSGRYLPIVRNFALAFDRETGARPNPAVTPGGWYISSSTQTLEYNAFEGNFRVTDSIVWRRACTTPCRKAGRNRAETWSATSTARSAATSRHRISSIRTSTGRRCRAKSVIA